MKRLLLVAVIFGLLLAACAPAGSTPTVAPTPAAPGSSEPPPTDPVLAPENVNVSIGTASLGGNFFAMGAAIAEVIVAETGYLAVAQATGGSVANVDDVHNGVLDVGISQGSAVSAAWNGLDHFEGSPITDIRTLAHWNATPIHILVRRSLNVSDITELGSSGARIEAMNPGDGIELSTRSILASVGKTFSDVRIEYSGNRVQSASRFHTGGVDAIFDGTGIGAAWMVDVIGNGNDFELISLTDEQIDAIITEQPDMKRMVIPAGTYNGQTEDVVTVGNWTVLYAHESMQDEVAYNITRAIHENQEALTQAHNFFADLAPENILDAIAPIHPGAERFFREIGVLP